MDKLARAAAFVLMALLAVSSVESQAAEDSLRYRSPEETEKILGKLAKRHKDRALLHALAETPGGRHLQLLELGENDIELPAVLVVANMEGNCPIASEAALELSRLLLEEWTGELGDMRWYIVPCGNPDGYARFFGTPLHERFVNERPYNGDNDEAVDEDGPEDLNADGYITVMRQVHPEGRWTGVESNPVLMKKADAAKGEQGRYRLFSEGIDSDGDGEINEDPPGGVNPGRNFPHAFRHHTETGGRWAASEVESRAILRFAFDHPEIAMVLVFGRSNSLGEPPESTKKQAATGEKYEVPERWAKRLGIDPKEKYALGELVELARSVTGYRELTEEMVLRFLGAGAAVNPDRRDLPYWEEISKRYNEFIEEVGLDAGRLAPEEFPPGSIDEWAYFQFGVPAFSMDFWTLPVKKKEKPEGEAALTPEKVGDMTNEEFLALGKERIERFLEENDAPAMFTADKLMQALESGMMTTKRIAKFMERSKRKEASGGADEMEQALFDLDERAFVAWEWYDHPTLGTVEIGGKIPYADLTPPPDSVPALVGKQLPFVRELVKLVPRVGIGDIEISRVGTGTWKVEAWVANEGFLPYPTYQGERCRRPTPVALSIRGDGITLLEGRERRVLGLIEGSGGTKQVRWLVGAREGSAVTLEAWSYSTGRDEITVRLTEGGGSR